jgi:hypothetical protein
MQLSVYKSEKMFKVFKFYGFTKKYDIHYCYSPFRSFRRFVIHCSVVFAIL